MKREPTETQYNEIAKYIANDDCILFLGSGISRGKKGENGIPGAGELATVLFDEIEDRKAPLTKYERRNLAKVANIYKIIKDKAKLDNFIKDIFEPIKNPLDFHKLIAQLPFKIIITTNYDCLLERQFEKMRKEFIRIVKPKDFDNWAEQKIIILKIHGCVENDRSLIISEDDYVKYLSNPDLSLFHDVLKYLFATKNVLFIGCSLADINIKMILEVVERIIGQSGSGKQYYLIQKNRIDDSLTNYWKNKNIEIFEMSGERFLKKLIKSFNTLKIEKKLGNKFNFYLNNYRLETLKFIKSNILKKFIEEIENDSISLPDYRFWNQLVETFRNKENQKELGELIKREKGIEIILNVISQINISGISKEIIIQLNDLMLRTDNESTKISVLDYLYKNNKVNDETLPTLETWINNYPEDSEMGMLLSSVLKRKR